MEDMERYGDYDDIDEPAGNKSVLGIILKILIGVVCLGVVGVLIFRIVLASYYPASVKGIYFNDCLTDYYHENGGDIEILTQTIRYNMDNGDEGNFFADNLILVRELGQVQLTIRYNTSVFANLETKYKIKLDPEAQDNFTFRLVRNPYNEGEQPFEVGRLTLNELSSYMMYRYHKLVFDEVDFELWSGDENEADREIDWIRVEILIPSNSAEPFGAIPIYESYIQLNPYDLSPDEVPEG